MQYLHHLAELEVKERRRKRIERCLKDSELPREKTLGTLVRSRLPAKVAKVLPTLCEGISSSAATTCWPSASPGVARRTCSSIKGHAAVVAMAPNVVLPGGPSES